MKLILCKLCGDVVALRPKQRTCECGASSGRYLGPVKATIAGPCLPIGFLNRGLKEAIENRPEQGMGAVFTAFVIPKDCETIKTES